MREQKIKWIYKITHPDYKSTNRREIMPPFSIYNTTCSVDLDKISDDEINRIYKAMKGK